MGNKTDETLMGFITISVFA